MKPWRVYCTELWKLSRLCEVCWCAGVSRSLNTTRSSTPNKLLRSSFKESLIRDVSNPQVTQRGSCNVVVASARLSAADKLCVRTLYGTCKCSMADWLADWLIKWLTDWLTGWLNKWLTGWLTGWLIKWLTGWLNTWLPDRLYDWSPD